MQFSNLIVSNPNYFNDYDADSFTEIGVSKKFSFVIFVKLSDEELINYIISISVWLEEGYEVYIFLSPSQNNVERIKNIFPKYAICEFLLIPDFCDLIENCQRLVKSDYFFLINKRSDIVDLSFEKLDEFFTSFRNPICISPFIYDRENKLFANIQIPKIKQYLSQNFVYTDVIYPITHFQDTLYPVSAFGVYHRKRISENGNFVKMNNDYQTIFDFFIRAYCSGFSALVIDSFRVVADNISDFFQKIDYNDCFREICFKNFSIDKTNNVLAKKDLYYILMNKGKKINIAEYKKYLFDFKFIAQNWVLFEETV